MRAGNHPALIAAVRKHFGHSRTPQDCQRYALDCMRLVDIPSETVTEADLVAALTDNSGPRAQETKFPDKWLDRLRRDLSGPSGYGQPLVRDEEAIAARKAREVAEIRAAKEKDVQEMVRAAEAKGVFADDAD